MVEKRRISWLQTLVIVVPIILSMAAFALTRENRLTVVELGVQELKQSYDELKKTTELLTKNQTMVLQTQATMAEILKQVNRRHDLEDQRRAGK